MIANDLSAARGRRAIIHGTEPADQESSEAASGETRRENCVWIFPLHVGVASARDEVMCEAPQASGELELRILGAHTNLPGYSCPIT